jgi:PAS domain S-box-containing protein
MTNPNDRGADPTWNVQLLERNERLAGIVESATDAIIVVDEQQRIVVFNAAAARMFGCPPHEAIGTHLERFVPPRFRAGHAAGFERARQTDMKGSSLGTLPTVWGLRATGEEFPCEASIAQHEVGGRREFTVIIRDITERQRSEDALRRRVEFETLLFELSHTFIGLPEDEVDTNMEQGLARVGTFLEMDRVTLFELSRDRTEMTVAYSWSAPGVSSATSAIAQGVVPWWMSQVLRGDVSLASHLDDLPEEAAGEKEYLRQRGIVSVASIPLRVAGEIVGAIGFVTVHRRVTWTQELVSQLGAIGDILWNALKRRQAMQALLAARNTAYESEERFRLAMNNVAAGVYTLDLQGLVIYVNPAAEGLFGWTMAELLGKKMHDVTHYKHPNGTPFPASECPGLQVLQTGTELREHEDIFIKKDGSFFPVVYSASPLKRDGTTVGIVVGFRDDTERRAAALAVRESEERFRLIANTAPVMIWMSDVDKQVTYVNQRWLDFTGWPPEVAPGHRWIELIHPDDVEGCGNAYVKAFDQRAPFQVQHRLRHHDGEYRWTVSTGVPRYGSDHAFMGYVGTAVDVTERKLAEDALQRSHIALRERTAELERRTTQLSQLASDLTLVEQRAREQLANTLHDGLQQQLAIAALHLEQQMNRDSQRGITAAPLARIKHELDEAITAARSLSVELSPPVLQRAGLATALAWLANWSRQKYGLEVHLSADSLADSPRKDIRALLFESVRELLFNVVKHARVAQVTVDLKLDANGNLRITVADQGIGFDPVELDKRANIGQGGWGLFSIRERLTLLRGQFDIESAPGRGSTFRLVAPSGTTQGDIGAASRSTHAISESIVPDATAGIASARTLRILVVDDHAAMREALRELLQAQPEFQVVGEAANGLEAIAQTRLLRPDLILMDVSMPEMGGVEATALIHAERPAIQIFGLSTQERIDDLHAIERAGGVGYFFKGADVKSLIDRLRQVRSSV